MTFFRCCGGDFWKRSGLLICVLVVTGFFPAFSKVKLPALVGSNMVLQRDKPIKIWGTADPGEKLSILFVGKTYHLTTPADGKWVTTLSSMKAGGPYTMQIISSDTLTLNNIMIGDVWVCSGQSNMFFKTGEAKNADQELANANYPAIRLFTVSTTIATAPQSDVKAKWVVCNPQTVKDFSAVGYFFGRAVQAKIGVPIGLIQSAFGGTPVEAWISAEGIKGDPQFSKQAATLAAMDKDQVDRQMMIDFKKWIDTIEKADPAYSGGLFPWTKSVHPEWKEMALPAYFENKDRSMKNRDGIVWFSKTIELDDKDISGDCSFNMGPVVDDDLVFINGVKIGGTRDAKYASRSYHVDPGILHPGANIISIRVIDYGSLAGINGKPEQLYFKSATGTLPLAGDWSYKVSLDTIFKVRHDSRLNQERVPCLLYNAMIAPITLTNIKGVIWYQGENNTDKAYQYRSLFQRLITDWRVQFKQPKLPFLYVQLANLNNPPIQPGNSNWAELREAQAMGLKLPGTAMVTAMDLGEASNIHPRNKQDVGHRLALLALNKVYKEPILASGPGFHNAKFDDSVCYVTFNDAGEGLKTNDGKDKVAGFQVATGSEKFTWADAVIVGKNRVALRSSDRQKITAVRYAWADNPGDINLINSAGLPAFPFRTDHFREGTYDARYDEREMIKKKP